MKASLKCVPAALPVILVLALLVTSVHAQSTFVYTNNNPSGANTVSAFKVMSGGALALVPGSPFSTAGTGTGFVFFERHIVTAAIARNFLYVSNDGSDDISAFSINATTGGLTLVAGSPFPTGGGSGSGASGIQLALSPNGKFLYAANTNSDNISAFKIQSDGSLMAIVGSPFALPAGSFPIGDKVSPNGKFLSVALPFGSTVATADRVAMFKIGPTPPGALTPVPGSPFPAGGTGFAADVDINCKSDLLFSAHMFNSSGMEVSVHSIASNGALTPISGSPFTFTSAADSQVGVLSPDNTVLFVSNDTTDQISSLDVAQRPSPARGTLTEEEGSPFANPPGGFPAGIGTNREGTLLYAANPTPTNNVSGFHIGSDGFLTPVTGSPFSDPLALGSDLLSLTVFPAHEDEGEGDEVDASGHKRHFAFEADHKCQDSGEMDFEDGSGGEMKGDVRAISVTGSTAIISGSGTLLDGTPVQYTALVTGNQPVIGMNLFSISWVDPTGSIFQTSGALINGYIAVH